MGVIQPTESKMSPPFPSPIWDSVEFHRQLMRALDDAFETLSKAAGFSRDWTTRRTVPGTKTSVRQTPMLGKGAPGRQKSGFLWFARRYSRAEGHAALSRDRYSFERYQDFAFYTDGDWYSGKKLPIMIAECESNANELLGELSGLMTIRCPFKYLFIEKLDTLNRLKKYCRDTSTCTVDWGNTTYYVIEIPDSPSRPSGWTTFAARLEKNGDALRFEQVV